MPKIKYYEDVKIIKKPLKKRILRYISFFCIALVFTLCIVVSKYFSNVLTVSGTITNFIYGDNSISKKNKDYYAVTLGEYSTFEEAEKVSLGVTIQGGSGYIWYDEKYSVIGSFYFTEDDAKKVVNNLQESNYNVSIKKVTLNSFDVKFDNCENKVVRKIEKAIDYFDELIQKLYSYSIDFDKSNLNNLAVSSYIGNLRGDCKVLISEMQGYLQVKDDNLQKIQNTLIKTDELLNEAILKTIDNTSTGYFLKYLISSVIRNQYELYASLK